MRWYTLPGIALAIALHAEPGLAVTVRGEFSGVFEVSQLPFDTPGTEIPEIPIGDPFTGSFEYDTEAFDHEPATDPNVFSGGATLAFRNSFLDSRMTRLSLFVDRQRFSIFLDGDRDNFDDSINGDPPFYFSYDLNLRYAEDVFEEPFEVPTALPAISKLLEAELVLLGYTNQDSIDFQARGRVDRIAVVAVPEPSGFLLFACAVGLLAARKRPLFR